MLTARMLTSWNHGVSRGSAMSERKLPPFSALVAMNVNEDMSLRAIAAQLGVSPSAVTAEFKRHGVEPVDRGRGGPREKSPTIPWTVAKEHQKDYVVLRLRALARREAGKPLKPDEESMLDRFCETLDDKNRSVDYDPRRGFFTVRRRPGERYVRHP